MNFKAINGYLLVEKLTAPAQRNGIHLPESAAPANEGVVRSSASNLVAIGSHIVFASNDPIPIVRLDGRPFLVLKDDQVVGIRTV